MARVSIDYFQVRTPNGYVGRWGLDAPLTDDFGQGMGYTYDTACDAQRVANMFPDAEVLYVEETIRG